MEYIENWGVVGMVIGFVIAFSLASRKKTRADADRESGSGRE